MYFKCLDKAGILKPGDEGKTCASEKSAYEKSCAKSWVCCFPHAFPPETRIEVAFCRSNTSIKDAYWLNSKKVFCSR